MNYEIRERLRNKQRRESEWDFLQSKWKARLKGELHDIVDPDEFKNATTANDGTKKFFLCDSAKVPCKTIKEKKYKLKKKVLDQPSLTSSSVHSLSAKKSASTDLPKLSIISKDNLTAAQLMQLSYVKPTLRADSFGPGDAHKRALSNYYHVQDSLPPDPIPASELKNGSIMLRYANAAPPAMPQADSNGNAPLLCGLTGKPLPFPQLVDPRTLEEKVSVMSAPVRAVNKNTKEAKKRVLMQGKYSLLVTGSSHYEREKERSQGRNSIIDFITEVSSARGGSSIGGDSNSAHDDNSSVGASSIASSSTHTGTSRLKTKNKTMSAQQVEEATSEMNSLVEEMESVGSGEKWSGAALSIKKHFNLLRNGSELEGKDFYKDVPIGRFYERFMTEGPRRGDGCFEADPKHAGVVYLEGILQRSKEYRKAQEVNKHNSDDLSKMKSTLNQRRALKGLEKQVAKAYRKLMKSEIWQRQHGRAPDTIKDKRDFSYLFEESESEEEETVVEKPKNEDLWLADTNFDLFKEKEKPKSREKEKYSEREVVMAGMEILEEMLLENLYENFAEILAELEERCLEACVIDVQARFRGWSWRNSNYKVVNRLYMRAKSRQKRRRAKEGAERGPEREYVGIVEQHNGNAVYGDLGGTEGGAGDGGGSQEPYVDEHGQTWQTLQDENGNWYYLNEATGESQWAE